MAFRAAWRDVLGLAARQHGAVARRQLRRLGVGGDAIDRALADRLLVSAHRGVDWVGLPGDSGEAVAMAAVLAYGQGAITCRHTAAYLFGFLPYPARQPEVALIVPGRASKSRPGIHVHRVPFIHPRDHRLLGVIPVTSPARTLLDLAASARCRRAGRAPRHR